MQKFHTGFLITKLDKGFVVRHGSTDQAVPTKDDLMKMIKDSVESNINRYGINQHNKSFLVSIDINEHIATH